MTHPTMMFLLSSAFLLVVVCSMSGSGRKESGDRTEPASTRRLLRNGTRPSLNGATGWLNSNPLRLESLRGKVVLIDFWTFTCINWRRTLPYIRAWEAKYKAQGLVVIGVHTPEFSFEYEHDNVEWAIGNMKIDYAVATDNRYEIWNAFRNQYWPARYLIDAKGKLRYEAFGESNLEETEWNIRKLLKDVSGANPSEQPIVPDIQGIELAADWQNLRSGENFLGYERTERFATPATFVPDKLVHYEFPNQLKLNQWALSGEWVMEKERVRLVEERGKIVYRFHARDLQIIMSTEKTGTPIRFRVLVDGSPPGSAHGLDIDADGYGVVREPRMYQLIRQIGPISDREFEIEFLDAGVDVYDVTFG